MKFEVEENVLKVTINYLTGKPYKETAQLIDLLQKSKPIEEKKGEKQNDGKAKEPKFQ